MDWIMATVAGFILGLIFYGFVRLRMYLGPIIRARYGQIARRLYWFFTIVAMIFFANVALQALRHWVGINAPHSNSLLLEIWFLTLAVAISFTLIYRRINRNR
jgi:hypothetical protein